MLRERYKDSLMANVVVPDAAAQPLPVPAKPVANPKLKIVKRKTSEAEPDTAERFSPPRTERVNTASDIANVLSANTAAATAVTPPVAKPAESAAVKPETVTLPQATSAVVKAAETTVTSQAEAITEAQPVVQSEVASTKTSEQNTIEPSTEPEQVAEPQQQTTDTTPERVAVETELTPVSGSAETVAAVKTAPLPAEQPITSPEITEPVELTESATAEQNDTALAAQLDEPAPETAVAADDGSQETVLQAEQAQTEVPYHIVQAAESLYAISVKHNIRLQRLMQWNQLTPESVIKTGQKIWLGPVSEQQLHRN